MPEEHPYLCWYDEKSNLGKNDGEWRECGRKHRPTTVLPQVVSQCSAGSMYSEALDEDVKQSILVTSTYTAGLVVERV